jgi:glutathione-regulated potassium-efflux system ancillary protein KefG
MRNVLIILAHPNLANSQINKALISAIKNSIKNNDNLIIHDLYLTYPDGVIDIDIEQEQLQKADVIIFQHPFYWYSAPALLKEWFDLVLQFDYAYGPNGNALKGKQWLTVITTGGSKFASCTEGHNRFTIRQLLTPFDQTAHLCEMEFLPPFVAHSARNLGKTPDKLEQLCEQYQSFVVELLDDDFDCNTVNHLDTLNQRWEQ